MRPITIARLAAAFGAALPLCGCVTAASGVIETPPGINQYSFTQCLAENGFFTDTALIGDAEKGYEARRRLRPRSPVVDPANLSPAARTALIAHTLWAGLLPHQQYGDIGLVGREELRHRADPHDIPAGDLFRDDSGFDPVVSDPRHNRPYINNLEGVPFVTGAAPIASPLPGQPARLDLPLNRYLDCYLAPVGYDEPGLSMTGDYDREGRLLRAHVLLAMLTAFGTELVTARPDKRQAEHATRLLGHVRDAELALRSASLVMNPQPDAAKEKPEGGSSGARGHGRRRAGAATPTQATATSLSEPFDSASDSENILRWYA